MLQRPVAVPVILIKVTGSVKLAVLWSQLLYWTERTKDPQGWIYKTQKDLYDETGMSRKEQETARDLGAKLGVLMSDVRGKPPTVHYRVDMDRMIELIERHEKENPAETKVKESRGVAGISYLTTISDEDVAEIAAKFSVTTKCVRERAQDVIDYCEAKGKRYSDYKAALRNFLKMHIQRHPDAVVRAATPSAVVHQQQDIRRDDMTPEDRARANKKLDEMRAELARKKAMNV